MPKTSPLYQQIRQLIVAALAAGEWRPGDALPSETALAERFHASPGTVRRALDELAAEHVVERRQGAGTFVATHTAPRNSYRFLRLVSDDGATGFTRCEGDFRKGGRLEAGCGDGELVTADFNICE